MFHLNLQKVRERRFGSLTPPPGDSPLLLEELTRLSYGGSGAADGVVKTRKSCWFMPGSLVTVADHAVPV